MLFQDTNMQNLPFQSTYLRAKMYKKENLFQRSNYPVLDKECFQTSWKNINGMIFNIPTNPKTQTKLLSHLYYCCDWG